MFEYIYPHLWMALPKDIRGRLVEVFGIARTGVSEIKDDMVISDGHSFEDLKVITLEKMSAYIGSVETSFPHAWEVTCSKAKYELNPPPIDISVLSQSPVEDLEKALETPAATTTAHAKTKKSKQK